jgi:hypothetical protein
MVQCDGAAKNGLYRYKFNWTELEGTLKGSVSLGVAMALKALCVSGLSLQFGRNASCAAQAGDSILRIVAAEQAHREAGVGDAVSMVCIARQEISRS